MDNFQIPENLLSPFCRGKLSENRFFPTNSIENINCCMELCNDWVSFCFNTCSNRYKGTDLEVCNQKCNELIRDCKSGCLEIESSGFDIVNSCAKNNGCGMYPIYNNKCLKSNRDKIIQCCKNECNTRDTIDCQDGNCEIFYDHLTGDKTFSLPSNNNINTISSSQSNIYIWVGLILSIILIITTVIYMRKIEK